MIVCSGGDGTLDEVVTGMMGSGVRRTIGYIPAGSTNDFGSSLGIPKQMEQAADLIEMCIRDRFRDSQSVWKLFVL